jgi:hypothetical protein
MRWPLRRAPWCWCGHEREYHRHYRNGTDCGTCGRAVCPRFRGPLVRRAAVLRW